jgi:hypothetical protein
LIIPLGHVSFFLFPEKYRTIGKRFIFTVELNSTKNLLSFCFQLLQKMAINELQDMNMLQLSEKLLLPDQEFETWMVEMGLLHGRQVCNNCGQDMKLTKNGTNKTWTCNRRTCRVGSSKPKKGYFNGTFFEGTSLPIKKIFHLSYLWTHQYGIQEDHEFEVGVSHATCVQWLQYFRDVCAEYFVNNPQQIGGPGITVEIDETCVSKRKYNRGRLIRPNQWMFGAIERGSGRALRHFSRWGLEYP